MRLKSVVLAAATFVSLAAPAAAFAQPYWGHDRDYREYRDHRHYRDYRDDRRYWRDRARWEDRRYGWDGPRCRTEVRGGYNYYGDYVRRPVRVCYR